MCSGDGRVCVIPHVWACVLCSLPHHESRLLLSNTMATCIYCCLLRKRVSENTKHYGNASLKCEEGRIPKNTPARQEQGREGKDREEHHLDLNFLSTKVAVLLVENTVLVEDLLRPSESYYLLIPFHTRCVVCSNVTTSLLVRYLTFTCPSFGMRVFELFLLLECRLKSRLNSRHFSVLDHVHWLLTHGDTCDKRRLKNWSGHVFALALCWTFHPIFCKLLCNPALRNLRCRDCCLSPCSICLQGLGLISIDKSWHCVFRSLVCWEYWDAFEVHPERGSLSNNYI